MRRDVFKRGLALALALASGCSDDATAPGEAADTVAVEVLFPDGGGLVDSTSSVDTVGPVADTAEPAADTVEPVADTAEPVADTQAPVDSATIPDTSSEGCVAGATACDGYVLMRCSASSGNMVVDRVCVLGCDAASGGAADCANACTPGETLGCVTATARRCGADGASARVLSCLSGCDAEARDCAPLGATEREVFAADLSGVRVAGVGGDDVGRLAFAWQANVTGTPEPIRLLVTDADGNALSAPVALGGSDGGSFAQLVVRGAPDGAFAVMALAGGATTVWHVPVGASGVPTPAAGPLVATSSLKFPSVVVWSDAVALYDLGPGSGSGETVVRRTTWPLSGGAAVEAGVDGASLARNDITVARVGAEEAHVFSAVSGALRVTVSTPTVAGGETLLFDAGELLFAGAAGSGGASVVAAFDFDLDPEHAVYARFAGGTLAAFGDAGPGRWVQATATAGGVALGLLASDGALRYVAAEAAVAPAPAAVWTPTAAGAERTDFWVVADPATGRVRLVTLGRNANGEGPRVRISAP